VLVIIFPNFLPRSDIPIETFLRFNKILALTKTSDDIVQAINNSEILELDKEKTKVKRNTEIKIKENVEDFTIYVVSLTS
jgi:predicted nucleotide-binding protein (sugar kinase/HSP70/actin superfamily)